MRDNYKSNQEPKDISRRKFLSMLTIGTAGVAIPQIALSGTFYDPIKDAILDHLNKYSITDIRPQDEVSGEIQFKQGGPTEEYDEITLPNATGSQDFVTKWGAIKPTKGFRYGIKLQEVSNPDTSIRLDVTTYNSTGETWIKTYKYEGGIYVPPSYKLAFTATDYVELILDKRQDNSIYASAKQDSGPETFIGVYENCGNLIEPSIRGPTNTSNSFSLLEIKCSGPNVQDVYNDAIPPSVPIAGLTTATLMTILFGTSIKKIK